MIHAPAEVGKSIRNAAGDRQTQDQDERILIWILNLL